MAFHIFDNLLNVGLHTLHFPVLLRQESHLRLDILFVVLAFAAFFRLWLEQCVPTHIGIMFVGLIILVLIKFRTIAEFVKTRSSIVVFEVVVDIEKRKLSHARSIENLRIDEPPSRRKSRLPVQKNKFFTKLSYCWVYIPWHTFISPSFEHLMGAI